MAHTDIPDNVAVLELRNNANVTTNTSLNGQQYIANFGNNYWSFKLKTPLMEVWEFYAVYKNFFQQTAGTVTDVRLPILNDAVGTVASGPVSVVNDSSTSPEYGIGVGETKIPVSGGSGTLLIGDLIKFSNHSKVYMLSEDTNLDGSSVDVINITPPLVSSVAPADGSTLVTITYDNVGMQVIAEDNVQEIKCNIAGLVQYQQKFREVI